MGKSNHEHHTHPTKTSENHKIHNHEDHHNHHKKKHSNHKDHHLKMIDDFKKRFIISIILSIPIIILSPMIQSLLHFKIVFRGSTYSLFILSVFVYFYGGWPFLKGLLQETKTKSSGMMTLIAMAISVAFVYSSAVVFGFKGKLFFWELATLIDIMLIGHWIEMRSVLGASKALEKLAQLIPDTAHLIKEGDTHDIPVNQLTSNDKILVKPGEKIPSDGIIIKGETHIDESMITGESKPINKVFNDKVIAGSVNGNGSIEVKVLHIGEDSYISKVINMVNEAQAIKSKTQHLADRAAKWLTLISITIGISTFIGWLLTGQEIVFAIERMATVMIITCPHALGLAIPLVVAVSTAQSAKNGLLIRNRTAFEMARNISVVVFDKTGTLTHGNFGVTEIVSFNAEYSKEMILQYAASIEKHSEHPIAQGIIKRMEEEKKSFFDVDKVTAITGKGITGTIKIKNKKISVVSPSYLQEKNLFRPDIINKKMGSTVYILLENKVIGSITLADSIREESKGAIQLLQNAGIQCWMLTGDNDEIAKFVSDNLELDGYIAEVLPHEKKDKVRELQEKGEVVAMTGDGINDAPALAQADVGIAIGSGTDIAAETADIILVESNPEDVSRLILFGRATYRKMIQNVIWATGYNIFAIPLAAGVFSWAGIVISPAMGAVLMSLSTIIVSINARLLKL